MADGSMTCVRERPAIATKLFLSINEFIIRIVSIRTVISILQLMLINIAGFLKKLFS